jgi:iron complex outermembrane recepter protein
MFRKTRVTTAALLAIGGVALIAMPAAAQEVQRIEITGTNIKRIDAETSSPVQVISREEIKRSGANSVKELLDLLPSASPTLSDIGGSNSFASGASSASLRNLGKTSTLILFNGRRVAPYALADFNEVFTNLDALPLDAVERIEVLRNGASAIYGSDAVAGVINIITRKDFSGVNIAANYERSYRVSDANQVTAAVTGGLGDLNKDGYNVLANIELFRRSNVIARDAIDEINPLRFRAGMIPTTFATQTSAFSYPGNIQNRVSGSSVPIAGCATDLTINGLCRYDRFQRFELIPEAERVNSLLSGRMRLGNDMQAFGEVLFSRTETSYISPFIPYGAEGSTTWSDPRNNSVQTFRDRGLPITHPLNSLGVEEPFLFYRFIDAPSGSTATATNYRALAGLSGSGSNYDWEVSIGALGSKVEDVQSGNFSNSGFIEVIGDYRLDVLPRDFFNIPGGYRLGQPNTPEVVNKLFPKFGSTGKTTQTVLDGKITGELGQLAGGPIGLAVGVDIRREKFTITPTDNLAAGDIVGLGLSSTDGKRTFAASFGEVSLPVTKGLEVQLAARLDKFPNIDTNVSPKLGMKWRVNDSLMFRGTAESGFRAPNLTETAPSFKFAFNNGIVDPQRCAPALALSEALRIRALGLPTTDPERAQLLTRADIVEQNECEAGVAAIVRNNPTLEPETSESFSFGMVLQPTRNVSVTFDFWEIQRKNEIDLKTADELLAIEGSPLPPGSRILRALPTDPDPTFRADDLTRYGISVGTRALLAIERGFENLFRTKTSGVDVGFQLTHNAPIGKLDFTAQAQYLIKYREFIGSEGKFGNNLAGDYTYPRVIANAGVSLTTPNWVHGLKVFSTSETTLQGDRFDPTGTPQWCAARAITICKVPAATTFDYYVRYTGVRNLTLGLYVRNIFDKYPPIDFRDQFGTPIPQETNDVRRRTFRASAEYKF